MERTIWIAWENHRRSRELANAFGAELITLVYREGAFWRYPLLVIKTIIFLIERRPNTLFVQNPSIVLTTVASWLKPVLHYSLIVDRHSNFNLPTMNSRSIKWRVFHALSKYTVKKADITIVTVESLRKLVFEWQGRAFVLQDKIPDMVAGEEGKQNLDGDFNIVCVTTFSSDEPIFEMVEAAELVDSKIHMYMTGKYQSFSKIDELQSKRPVNVTFTGFVSEDDYIQLLNSADSVMVLTVMEDLLTCGAYEAVALNKPMILSNTRAISGYFFKGAAYANPDSKSISQAVMDVKKNYDAYLRDTCDLRIKLDKMWLKRFNELKAAINNI